MKKQLLFVCLGNICRSPSSEAVMNALIKEEGMCDEIECDSAGIIGVHAGEPADRRMQQHAFMRGVRLNSISRQFNPHVDFNKFDLIIGMDDQNISDLRIVARNEEDLSRIYKMTDFCSDYDYDSVPDPYYGGAAGFELVLDLLNDACSGLMKKLKEEV